MELETIEIEKIDDSPVKEGLLPISLSGYTIFAGENNSGKSHIARHIEKKLGEIGYRVIFIPAEHARPQENETDNSKVATEFSKLLKSIIDPVFGKDEFLKNLVENFENSQIKKDFVTRINKILKDDFGIDKKEFDIKVDGEDLKNDFIIKIIKAFVRDLYDEPFAVDFEKIGMGTQRLIVAALIRYYSERKAKESEKLAIIFEEPEIYLHPKWKAALYKSLQNLLVNQNVRIIVTTHDPYFIELGKNQAIYQVNRSGTNNATSVKLLPKESGLLGYNSDSEKNYLVFGIPSKTYFAELYEFAKYQFNSESTYDDFDQEIYEIFAKDKGLERVHEFINPKNKKLEKFTDLSAMRMILSHANEKNEKRWSNMKIDLEKAIEYMTSFIEIKNKKS